jgi:hypothetical protein
MEHQLVRLFGNAAKCCHLNLIFVDCILAQYFHALVLGCLKFFNAFKE